MKKVFEILGKGLLHIAFLFVIGFCVTVFLLGPLMVAERTENWWFLLAYAPHVAFLSYLLGEDF